MICTGPHRGEPQKLDEKQVRAALSATADNTPWVAPIKSALQMVTGTDLGTDEPVSCWGELAGVVLGIAGGKGIAKILSKGLGTLGKKIEKQMEKRGWDLEVAVLREAKQYEKRQVCSKKISIVGDNLWQRTTARSSTGIGVY